MKKIFAPILIFVLFSACSSDGDVGEPIAAPLPAVESFLKATIDGVEHTYSKIVVETETVSSGTNSYIDLHFDASTQGDSSAKISFKAEQFRTGTGVCRYFYLKFNNMEYEFDALIDPASMFMIDITSNDSNHLFKGNFSGTLRGFDGTHTLVITSGSFQTRY